MDIFPAFLMGASGMELLFAAFCFAFRLDRAGFFLVVLALLMLIGAMVR